MVDVDIDDKKFEILEARGKEKGFETAEEYIDHLMSQVVQKISREEESVSEEDEEKVKEKLEELGYM